MTRTLTITYNKSNEDTPVLCVAESNIFSMVVRKIFTGEKAEQLYNELTGQNVIVKVENENRPEFLRECFNKPINTQEEEKITPCDTCAKNGKCTLQSLDVVKNEGIAYCNCKEENK